MSETLTQSESPKAEVDMAEENQQQPIGASGRARK